MVRERALNDGVEITLPQMATSMSSAATSAGSTRSSSTCSRTRSSSPLHAEPVAVHASQVNGEIRVSVADTGPGIAAEDHERIFEDFQQTQPESTTTREPGSASRSQNDSSNCKAADLGRKRTREGKHVRIHPAGRLEAVA